MMKKNIYMIFAVMAGAASLFSCSDVVINDIAEEKTNDNKVIIFSASQEGCDDGTRAAIGTTTGTGASAISKIVWSEGDALNYFGATSGKLVLTDGAGSSIADFVGEGITEVDDEFALYPYDENATIDNGVITANIPMTQIATPGSFDPKAAVMVGTVSDKNDGSGKKLISFKNVASFIKITTDKAYAQISVKSIEWRGVAGKVFINASDGTLKPTEQEVRNGNKITSPFVLHCDTAFVRLIPKKGETSIPAGTYFIAVAPQTLSGGTEFIFTDTDNKVNVKKAAGMTTFARNMVKPVPVPSSFDYTVGKVSIQYNGATYTFADRNIGASKIGTEDGATEGEYFGDYFAWGELSPYYNTISWVGTTATISFKDYINPAGTPDGYLPINYPWWDGTQETGVQPYAPKDYNGTNYNILTPDHDIAHMLWGGQWRMPDHFDIGAFMGSTTDPDAVSWNSSPAGLKRGNLFLPRAGYISQNQAYATTYARYWSSYRYEAKNGYCGNYKSGTYSAAKFTRYGGCPIRPICD